MPIGTVLPWLKINNLSTLIICYLACSAKILVGIDGSINYETLWSTVTSNTKSIIRRIEKISGVTFGYQNGQTQLAVEKFPRDEQSPALSFSEYTQGKLNLFS